MLDGIGHNIGRFINTLASFFLGLVIGFVYGWKLTLVIVAVSPLLAIASRLMGMVRY